tara:strand:- start:1145 stop:1573 length:429 start_codon:yes stop_codon:yes gene_type:complete
MIKYNLVCKRCKKSFDSWFASSVEYEKLKKLKHINCLNCNSLDIQKNIMSPNVVNSKNGKFEKINIKKHAKIKKIIKKYQKFIKNNFEYVGENFTYEARSIHYNNKKKSKGIYGKTSLENIKELNEEGIQVDIIPWINEKDN